MKGKVQLELEAKAFSFGTLELLANVVKEKYFTPVEESRAAAEKNIILSHRMT